LQIGKNLSKNSLFLAKKERFVTKKLILGMLQLTTQNTTRFVVFIPPQPIIAAADCVLCCEVLFFLGINNRPTYTQFPAKINSGFWPTTQNLQNQQCCCMGLAKQQGQIQ
jgi:hypothetical protein